MEWKDDKPIVSEQESLEFLERISEEFSFKLEQEKIAYNKKTWKYKNRLIYISFSFWVLMLPIGFIVNGNWAIGFGVIGAALFFIAEGYESHMDSVWWKKKEELTLIYLLRWKNSIYYKHYISSNYADINKTAHIFGVDIRNYDLKKWEQTGVLKRKN